MPGGFDGLGFDKLGFGGLGARYQHDMNNPAASRVFQGGFVGGAACQVGAASFGFWRA